MGNIDNANTAFFQLSHSIGHGAFAFTEDAKIAGDYQLANAASEAGQAFLQALSAPPSLIDSLIRQAMRPEMSSVFLGDSKATRLGHFRDFLALLAR